jgi:hypothetical protein
MATHPQVPRREAAARSRCLGPCALALALVCLAALFAPRPALANMARSYWSGEQHGPLVAPGPTTVRVDDEELTFVLGAELGAAEVTARYRMTNGGAAPAGGEVAFVYVRGDRDDREASAAPVITVDGAAVELRRVEGAELPAPALRAWGELPAERLAWLVFRLDFTPGQARTVEVRYAQLPSRDLAERVNPTYAYDYLLSPARSWASFGPLHLRVRAPAGTALLSSTIPLARDGEGYRAELAGLPDRELSFTVMSTAGLWFGMSTSGGYLRLVALALALLTLPAAWLGGRLLRRASPASSTVWITFAGGGLVFGLGLAALLLVDRITPRRAFGFGYGGAFTLAGLLLLCVLVGMAVATAAGWRRAGAAPGSGSAAGDAG